MIRNLTAWVGGPWIEPDWLPEPCTRAGGEVVRLMASDWWGTQADLYVILREIVGMARCPWHWPGMRFGGAFPEVNCVVPILIT